MDIWTTLREMTFGLFFVKGSEPIELKKAFKKNENLNEADHIELAASGRKIVWRMLGETYMLLAEALGSVRKYNTLIT